MAEEPTLEQRVTALERRLQEVAADAGAARILAAGADQDASAFRTVQREHTQVLNAIRDDQTALRAEMDRRFAKVDERFDKVDETLEAILNRLPPPPSQDR